ncbi:hypothetical protein [uncultured Nostoc sp.]|uniref:hypothetical protein n=1 Tax=uncultured Nostoc sp. TaxID=340711 RepID=UPI0035CB4A32
MKTSIPAGTPAAAATALRFLPAKKRKQIPATNLTYLQLLPQRYDFYKRKSKNRYVQPAKHTCSCCPRIAIFAIKKAKMAKDVSDKKALTAGTPAAGTAAPVLRFLQAEKRK